jgi:CBS domain-containing protein
MGDQTVQYVSSAKERADFASRLLNDLKAIELMHARGIFETGVRRIGAEQEYCIVDSGFRPSLRGPEILAKIQDPHFTTELARYTLEINLDPLPLVDRPFTAMHRQLDQLLKLAADTAAEFGDKVVLAGILPSIGMSELDIRFMTPAQRYELMGERIRELRGGDIELAIQGVDDIMMRHNNIMFEACNTSFQVHLQIDPENFVDHYNWAQAISGPVLAIATNSPLLFGRELWAETRLALFQQSVDTRTRDFGLRQRQARVYFGKRWLRHSIGEIFQEDIARYPLFVATQTEDSLAQLERGEIPKLRSLALHNGTIWKWNRLCFGSDGQQAHLRLENRYLPAGPTTSDEIANAAFWVGLMCGMPERYRSIWEKVNFLEVRENFVKSAQHGLEVELSWQGKTQNARRMILDNLLPIAQAGLEKCGVAHDEITKYLGIIEHRAVKRMTGSRWQKQTFRSADPSLELLQKQTALTAKMWEYQQTGLPVADWQVAKLVPLPQPSIFNERVDLLMTTDLISVLADDLLAVVQQIMNWRGIRHIPVEDEKGNILGIITNNDMARFCEEHRCQDVMEVRRNDGEHFTAADLMVREPVCVAPETTAHEARQLMLERQIGCVPVVRDKKLMGLLTREDILRLDEKARCDSV